MGYLHVKNQVPFSQDILIIIHIPESLSFHHREIFARPFVFWCFPIPPEPSDAFISYTRFGNNGFQIWICINIWSAFRSHWIQLEYKLKVIGKWQQKSLRDRLEIKIVLVGFNGSTTNYDFWRLLNR